MKKWNTSAALKKIHHIFYPNVKKLLFFSQNHLAREAKFSVEKKKNNFCNYKCICNLKWGFTFYDLSFYSMWEDVSPYNSFDLFYGFVHIWAMNFYFVLL